MSTLAFFGGMGMGELIVLGLLGLLIFGKRLPEVGKNLGKGIIEFKKGLSGVEEDIDRAAAAPPRVDPPRIAPPPESLSAEDQLRAENERLRAQLAQKSQH